MKTIGIVSDTHSNLADDVLEIFSGHYAENRIIRHLELEGTGILPQAPCDLILHAGDIGYADVASQWILDALQDIAPLFAVAGNCDWPDKYILNGKELPLFASFEEDGVSFAMLHSPTDLNIAVRGAGALTPAYIKPMPKILVHGHTHLLRTDLGGNGVLTLCPGSPSKPKDGLPSVLVVKVEEPGLVLSVDAIAVSR